MKLLKRILLVNLLIFGAIVGYGQTKDTVHMQKLTPILGHWSGEGWVKMQNGKTHEFRQTELMQSELDGQVIIVNGKGYDKETNKKTFEALGVLNYDSQKDKYIFNTYTLDGKYAQASAKFEENTLVWWFEVDRGTIRYEINFTDAKWVEDGYFVTKDDQKYPFFHMELKKEG